jgi:hypothetical protein
MQNLYLVRTATVVSLAAVILAAGWIGMPNDEMQIAPEMVAVSRSHVEPAVYFPAGYELQPGADDGAFYDYY